ncbi:ABC transporter permease [Candidatus Micrarchaeota archaeon]|nr:ABC transporter permease [Candidatus Micrarchaeota archaeon]
MKPEDIFDIALTNIRHRSLRSWLTILGIIIGVASIITLISISVGMQQDISERTSSLGANVITVSPGGQQAMRSGSGMFGGGGGSPPSFDSGSEDSDVITFREADILRTLPGVYRLDARLQERAEVSYKNENTSLTVIGTEPDAFEETIGIELADGRYLNVNDKYSAVLGYRVATGVFTAETDEDLLNKQIYINDVPFRVVGYLAESGGMGGSDNSIYIPQETARDLFDEQEDVSEILVVAREGHDVDDVAETLTEQLLDLHGLEEDEADFQVSTATTIESTVSSITDTLGLFLGGIASISLIVGGIGVINTMFMSVLEQTKTIGIFKSLGAKNRHVIYIFICEAAIIGFIGGFLGVALSFIASFVLQAFGLPTAITIELVALGLFFSVLVGVFAGILPARNAASISPVEALRYE